eukprot:CAMPEP_0197289220 /NCGR_PEP_ID=MMETSP0890-20130614/6452_1 /TAXON_ID=44058 ORGANISM="Aureoumbra lagunensis, Strain CCMP1510" /NCGR_SAMPLE_ID=MMETSP0890 /ASSEMBLY_ACC=CAM_ASM_000533 /LENGTH=376 /DNA_ID=CAMNT_0042760481 /DNA_START=129 /DNA_END=1256 /DNA_ORIENTATION=+
MGTITKRCDAPLLKNVREAFEGALSASAWVLSGDEKRIMKKLVAKNWSAAIGFINDVSEIAEKMNHHPDIHLCNYRQVELILTTHASSGLTQIDLDMAQSIDKIQVEFSPKWLREEKAIAEQKNDVYEDEIEFDKEHFVKGLNGDFSIGDTTEILSTFRGVSDTGGGGKFEDPETRDIAAAKNEIIHALCSHAGLGPGQIVADIGAGTGLLTQALSEAVTSSGKIIATDVSPVFLTALRDRLDRLNITNVTLLPATDKDPGIDDTITLDLALLIDVYHHFLFPRTILRKLRSRLSRTAALVVIDFHRDPKRVKSQGEDWVLRHIRADQATFTKEILSVGFTQVAELQLPCLPENYFLIFKKRPLPTIGDSTPGANW